MKTKKYDKQKQNEAQVSHTGLLKAQEDRPFKRVRDMTFSFSRFYGQPYTCTHKVGRTGKAGAARLMGPGEAGLRFSREVARDTEAASAHSKRVRRDIDKCSHKA